jgi:hypothetical protein
MVEMDPSVFMPVFVAGWTEVAVGEADRWWRIFSEETLFFANPTVSISLCRRQLFDAYEPPFRHRHRRSAAPPSVSHQVH